MSTNAAVATTGVATISRSEGRAHHVRLVCGYVLAVALIAGLAIYGFDYYTLGSAERPFSPNMPC